MLLCKIRKNRYGIDVEKSYFRKKFFFIMRLKAGFTFQGLKEEEEEGTEPEPPQPFMWTED